MSPEDQNYGAGAEVAHQADSIERQMAAEAAANMPESVQEDKSILAELEKEDNDIKSLSDIIHGDASAPIMANNETPTPLTNTAAPSEGKKSKNLKPIIIPIVCVAVLAIVGLGVWAILSSINNDNGGAKPDQNRMAFFVEGEDGDRSYAIFNDKGEQLTGYDYEKISDFNESGYAIAKKVNNSEVGIITNIGKLSIPYGKYSNISAFGDYFIVSNDDDPILIDGSGEKIMDVRSSKEYAGLYSVYDGSTTSIFDKHGKKINDFATDDPFPQEGIVEKTMCINVESKLKCYDSESGEEILSIDVEKPLKLSSFGASRSRECMVLTALNTGRTERYLYYYGDLRKLNDVSFDSITIINNLSSNLCYFKGNKNGEGLSVDYAVGIDGKSMRVDNTARMVFRDTEHYAYFEDADTADTFRLIVHMNGEEKTFTTGVFDTPDIAGGKGYIAVRYGNTFAMYKDDIEPVYQLDFGRTDYIKARLTTDIDENNNIATGNNIINVEKGIVYKFQDLATPVYITYKNGLYYVRKTLPDNNEYVEILKKDTTPLIEYGKYETITIKDNYFLAKKNNEYTLLDSDAKVLLDGYEAITVTRSHIEAIKERKIQYFTPDAKKIK